VDDYTVLQCRQIPVLQGRQIPVLQGRQPLGLFVSAVLMMMLMLIDLPLCCRVDNYLCCRVDNYLCCSRSGGSRLGGSRLGGSRSGGSRSGGDMPPIALWMPTVQGGLCSANHAFFSHIRPYYPDSTVSRPICEVKQGQVRLVLAWGTSWEVRMLYIPFCYFLHFFALFFGFFALLPF
jgi:hypothetical protein